MKMKILANVGATLISCLAVSVWFLGSGCLAISCYQCGSLDGDALPCDIFTKAPMWRQFQVECPPDHLCAKSITTHYDNDNGDGTTSQTSEVRGCAPAENAFQVRNAIGCGQDDQPDRTVLCLCGTDLCNDSNRPLWSLACIIFSLCLSLRFVS